MPVSPDARRKLVPITTHTGTEFRYMVTGEARPVARVTKWAACEIKGGKKEPTETRFGIVGMTSIGTPVYGPVETRMMKFTQPCPLGKPPRPPKKTKKAKGKPAAPPISTIQEATPI